MTSEERSQLQPFFEALEGLKKNGFQGIARAQTVEWPLSGKEGQRRETLEIIVELRKDSSPV
jgi:hypothetical protein